MMNLPISKVGEPNAWNASLATATVGSSYPVSMAFNNGLGRSLKSSTSQTRLDSIASV
jgi:hypothetical protein